MSVQTNRPTLNFKPSRELCIDCDEIIEIQQLREHKAICGKNHRRPDTASKPSDVDNLDFPPAFTWEPKFNANEGEAAAASTSCIKPPSPQQGKNYKTYISIIDDDEDDDPSFLAALEASIAESKATQNIALDTMHASIESFISANLKFEDDEDKQHIIISRKFIHNSTIRAISRENFTFFKPLAVTFSGGGAVDTGGPKREYLRLLMSGIGKSSVFDGVWLSHNLELLHTKQYEIAGKLIAWSILQGGPGPRCIKPEIFNLLVGNKVNNVTLVDSCTDKKLQSILRQMIYCNKEEFDNVTAEHQETIANYGYAKIYRSKFQDKEEIIGVLLKFHFLYSVHAEMQQMKDGLNAIGGFGDIVFGCAEIFNNVLGNEVKTLTYVSFKKEYCIMLSEAGSNRRAMEEMTIYSFEVFLQDLEEKQVGDLRLEDLLIFITGADKIPPLGFDSSIKIDFYDFQDNNRRLPHASTCSPAIFLPRGMENPDTFKELMKEVLTECHGFGLV
eukprot:gene6413-7144_t